MTEEINTSWHEQERSKGEREREAAWRDGAGDAEVPNNPPVSKLDVLIQQINARYFVVNEAGKVKVMEWVRDPVMKRLVLVSFSFEDFKKLYMNSFFSVERPDKPEEKIPIAKIWLANPLRRQYTNGVVFDPTDNAPWGFLNLWSGWPVKPKPGDWSKLRNHIYEVICNRNETQFNYVICWLARAVQYPNKQGEVAIVIRGKKGTGKGAFGRWVVALFGQHGMQISSGNHLVGRFNAHLRDCIVIFADEAFFAGDRAHEGVLKALVTEPTIIVEGKFKDAVPAPNMTHVIMASNDDWVIPASSDERRYLMLNAAETYVGNRPYFAAIDAQMETGGRAAMLHDLLKLDISKFEVRDVPQSDALDEQKKHSLDSMDRWLLAVLERGYVYRSRFGLEPFRGWRDFVTTELLEKSYQQFAHDERVNRPANRVALGIRLTSIYGTATRSSKTDIIGEVETAPFGTNDPDRLVMWHPSRPWGYQLGPLDQAQATFTDKRGVPGDSWLAES